MTQTGTTTGSGFILIILVSSEFSIGDKPVSFAGDALFDSE